MAGLEADAKSKSKSKSKSKTRMEVVVCLLSCRHCSRRRCSCLGSTVGKAEDHSSVTWDSKCERVKVQYTQMIGWCSLKILY